ncbi:hypothetical protein [Clostridium culturomicium]|uniref:hypothetical protein n=1 Tax=Clostridium culturomicium TaxID=1499683 RepID=UPI000A4392B8|nr:hypothetical protein [Clostridium culturomicium]
MDNYKKEFETRERRTGGLVNLILDYAIENQMSAKEIDECVEIAKEAFYSDALIRRN